jgi:hypothetical protein
LTLIVAGQGRKSGKTTAMCDIIAATADAEWTAVKVTAHAHGARSSQLVIIEENLASTATDTGRYLAAGARRSMWVRCVPADIARAITPFTGGNLIVESNSATSVLPAEFIVFIVSDGVDSKPSAAAAATAAHVHAARIGNEVIARIRSILSARTA